MTHALSGTHRKRLKRIRRNTKGLRGISKGHIRMAIQRMEKGLQHSYAHTRERKSDFRSLWIQRINAAVREHGMTYSQFIHGLSKNNMSINRKMLAELAIHEPLTFKSLVDRVVKS